MGELNVFKATLIRRDCTGGMMVLMQGYGGPINMRYIPILNGKKLEERRSPKAEYIIVKGHYPDLVLAVMATREMHESAIAKHKHDRDIEVAVMVNRWDDNHPAPKWDPVKQLMFNHEVVWEEDMLLQMQMRRRSGL